MGRFYRGSIPGLSGAAAMDLVQVNGVSGKLVYVHAIRVAATNSSPPAQQIPLRCRVLPATVTNGSGGSSITLSRDDPGDAAATVTATGGNTTKATTSGTARVVMDNSAHVSAGFDYMFPRPILVEAGEAFVFELTAALTGSVTLAAGVEVEERG